jgi:hypothetical protein
LSVTRFDRRGMDGHMTLKEKQLAELIAHTARSITHLTAAMTSLSFDLLRSADPDVRGAGRRMIVRMEAVSHELDRQWALIDELVDVPQPTRLDAVEEVHLHSVT